MSRRFASLLLVIALVHLGCVAKSKYMAEASAPAPPLGPAPGMASVVFMRPSGLGGAITFMIIDQNGHFVGDSTAGGHFSAELPPGEYLFIAEGENTAVMHANLGPDRLYYVEVVPKMGIFSARVGLEPIKPGGEGWSTVGQTLRETTRFIPLAKEGQASLDAVSPFIAERVTNAKKKWAEYSPAERAESSLQPEDGVGSQLAAQPAPATAPLPSGAPLPSPPAAQKPQPAGAPKPPSPSQPSTAPPGA